jgi:alcohol dehydrogenase
MQHFDFEPHTRLVVGPDCLELLGRLVRELQAERALVVSDPGIIAAGHTERGVESLNHSGVQTMVFAGVHENPTTTDVDHGVRVAREFAPRLIVGLGGGSSMDCAKAINFLYSNGGRMQDYWGIGKAQRPMLPMVAVPTTAGTGSEAQSFALITDPETGVKMACGDKKAHFRVAILDPKLTITQPPLVTAMTGIDALTHAVETFVTNRRNAISDMFSREAWRRLTGSFERVVQEPDDLEARANMQWGACLAGIAIENSMLGAAHALANPLTANHGIVHGHAVGLMLPHVVRFNRPAVQSRYDELDQLAVGPWWANGRPLADRLVQILSRSGLTTRLSESGVPREALPDLARQAAQQWTVQFNPRPLNDDDLLSLYEDAF